MKKIFIFSFLIMFLMTALSVDLDAQYSSKKRKKKKKKPTTERNSDYFDESGGALIDRLWFGADVNLNLFGLSGQSEFTYGLSPMVGYKITDDFSIGPKISFSNTIGKYSSTSGVDASLNALNLGGGIFARHKVLTNYFVHAEYELISEEQAFNSGTASNPLYTIDTENKIITQRNTNSHYYLGGGYGGGNGTLSFATYALWDFSQQFTASSGLPIVVRFGIAYKF